jgi:glycogen operon protein
VLRRRSFFRGAIEQARAQPQAQPDGAPAAAVPSSPAEPHYDVLWISPDGKPLAHDDWNAPDLRALGMLLPGGQADEQDETGHPLPSETLLLLMNGGEDALEWALPPLPEPGGWRLLLDTASEEPPCVTASPADPPLAALALAPQALALLQFVPA